MNEEITHKVLQEAIDKGVRDFIVCPGSRNSSFVEALRITKNVSVFYWPEERSAAYFAMGRSRRSGRPAAVITTSGTAAGELLPAAMEAHYTGVPLLLITADRPPCFRGSGAPQSAEQLELYGVYAHFFQDVDQNAPCDLSAWNLRGPAHLNVCLSEPQSQPKFVGRDFVFGEIPKLTVAYDLQHSIETLDRFFEKVKKPFIIVSTLKPEYKEPVAQLLLQLQAPVQLEGVSGLREDSRLQHLRIKRIHKILETAKESDYPVDGVLRIGGIATHRVWRDLEYLEDAVQVCGISDVPFSGLSWNRRVVCAPIDQFLTEYKLKHQYHAEAAASWLSQERRYAEQMHELFTEEPNAEASLLHELSKLIGKNAHVYLGNSLPIREWDMAAWNESRNIEITASRGLNGIDGQLSTFLGLCQPQRENWAILGDLTLLYDMAGFWIMPQLKELHANVVVINNGGGQIFSRMYPYREMLNEHQLNFEPLANMWNLAYARWNVVPANYKQERSQLIEIVPDAAATERLTTKIAQLKQVNEFVT